MRTYVHRNMITQIAYNMHPMEEWKRWARTRGPLAS
jgi:hypothetical protein